MDPIYQLEKDVIEAIHYTPAVSLIMPFHPIMSSKREIENRLQRAVEKVESKLMGEFPREQAVPVLEKLHRLIAGLNYSTHKKSIAIFVSPLVEKVYYLDIPVEEKVVVDDSFEIRDLVYSKKEVIQYLVLLLSAERSKMYLGNCTSFLLIKSNVPDNVHAYVNDRPEKVANFSDPVGRKEVMLDKFLHHMDTGLSLILQSYPLPVFVLGPQRVLGHFRKITHHKRNIIHYIHGNYTEASETEIREALQPYLADWKMIRQQAVLGKVEHAADEKKLVSGMRDIWTQASGKNSRLLVVEKDFVYPVKRDVGKGHEDIGGQSISAPFYIKDAVDGIMEKVLQAGGDIEFVENGTLKDYDHIALIKYY